VGPSLEGKLLLREVALESGAAAGGWVVSGGTREANEATVATDRMVAGLVRGTGPWSGASVCVRACVGACVRSCVRG